MTYRLPWNSVDRYMERETRRRPPLYLLETPDFLLKNRRFDGANFVPLCGGWQGPSSARSAAGVSQVREGCAVSPTAASENVAWGEKVRGLSGQMGYSGNAYCCVGSRPVCTCGTPSSNPKTKEVHRDDGHEATAGQPGSWSFKTDP